MHQSRAAKKCEELVRALIDKPEGVTGKKPIVLVIGGRTIGSGAEALYTNDRVGVIALDIYHSVNAQLIADAHDLPLADGCVDAVWIQAVLEHVIDPARVVAEIGRVLRPDGLVYAETPFMQQVHEGAFDFWRFPQGGHRWLFRRFERLDDGVVAGPGTTLLWAIRYFVAGLTRSRTAGAAAAALCFWLRFFDRLTDSRHGSEGASCVYFFGRKRGPELDVHDLVKAYAGAGR